MAVDPLDHRGVEPRAGREREPAIVHAREVDGPRLPRIGEAQQVLGGVDDVGRDAEHAAVHVRRPAGEDREDGRGAGEPVGGLVDGAVAAERGHYVVALVGGRRTQLGRVSLAPRVDGLDLEAPLERVDDQLLEPDRHRRRVRVDDHEHAPRPRRRLERRGVGEPFERGGLGGGNHHGPEHQHTAGVTRAALRVQRHTITRYR
jgi:hypothetical protein